MVLQASDKLLVVHRSMFDGDLPRHFVGEVVAYADGLAKAWGFAFVRNAMSGEFVRVPDPRVRMVALGSPSLLVYELPRTVAVQSLRVASDESRLLLTDDAGFVMSLIEPSTGRSV
jgi:hypothetical protein